MKKFELQLKANSVNIEAFIKFIKENLTSLKVEKKQIVKTVLSSEDILAELIAHSNSADDDITVRISSAFAQISVQMTCRGRALTVDEIKRHSFDNDLDEETNEVISRLMDTVVGSQLTCTNRRGVNICDLKVATGSVRALYVTLFSIVFGLLCGLIMKNAFSPTVSKWISDNIFASISTMFINALKLIIGPLVFFSIASSIAGFSNIKTLGKIALNIVSAYICTSLVAIVIGFFVYHMFPVGDPSLQNVVSDAADSYIKTSQSTEISIKNTIVNIIPVNIINPFLNGDMLQIVFVSVLIGIVVSAYSKRLRGVAAFFDEGNFLFGKVTEVIIKFLPLAVFSAMAKLILTIDLRNVGKVFACIPVTYLGCLMMILVYSLIILLFGRLNPLKFLKKFMPVALVGYGLSSSNGAMPYSIDCCDKKLGISKNLYSFSIPLGATINMDGTCVSLVVVSLFLAKIFGIELSGSQIMSLVMSIIILSVGAPGVPGTNLICTALLLPQLGVPMEALSLIMGVHTLIGMGNVFVNITGDAAITTVVARKQKMIDLDKYNS